MSKIIREKHLKIIELLSEATGSISRQMDDGKLQESLQLLAECQDAAITLGTHIEKRYGMQTQTVAALEQYCNALYQVSVAMGEGEAALEAAMREWSVIADSVHVTYEKEFPEKKEVVFLPYNASMWDSLESVWKAADEDPDCEAYVVPIPYYDLDANRNFIKKHYEGDLYPDYVPITHYEDYDLEERRPDMIFIHNPYDEANRVTSIATEFYSSRIKHFTEKLVYIPYFVLGEIIFDHFCALPGVIHSDYVIVQSNDTRKVYIKKLKEYAKNNPVITKLLTDEVLEKKIIALGSPKIDKVVNSNRVDFELPEKWAEILKGKKAVLYNTGITGLLLGNEKELEKMRDVFNVFKDRKDAVLWWRPHPLNTSTLKAMRPSLYEQYIKLIEQYKKEEVGIFDDTRDLYRALMWTDIYYGDDSSLVYLYGVQGKPIIKQNIMVSSNTDYVSLDFNISLYKNGTLWVVARDHNGLYEIDLLTGNSKLVEVVPNEQEVENKLYSNLVEQDDTIWMVPFRAHCLTGYNVKTKEFEQYQIKDRIKFSTIYENKIYMISYDYKTLWIFDLKSRRMAVEEIRYRELVDENSFPLVTEYYSSELYFKNNKMYFIILHTNLLVEYNLESKKVVVKSIGNKANKFGRLDFINNAFWFFPVYQSAKITRWDGDKIIEIDETYYPKKFQNTFGFAQCKYWNKHIWLFPVRGNMILDIDPETMLINPILKWGECLDVENVHIVSDKQILMTTSRGVSNRCLRIMNSLGEELIIHNIRKPQEHKLPKDAYLKRLVTEEYISEYSYECNETEEVSLSKLIEANMYEMDFTCMKKYFKNLYAGGDGNAGVRIWNYVKG